MDIEQCIDFSTQFSKRFEEFRKIEFDFFNGRDPINSCPKAFTLLQDMELCYSARAYNACIIVSFTAIEACLNNEFGDRGQISKKILDSGYQHEIDWLRKLRNKIIHKNDPFLVYENMSVNKEVEMDEICKEAFLLAHQIYLQPIKSA